VISELDIRRAATLLIPQHGPGAELEAARLRDLMLDRGGTDEQRVETDQAAPPPIGAERSSA
jgi:hypothetical protein